MPAPRRRSNREAFGSYHVTPPPVRRAPAPPAQAPAALETKEPPQIRPDNVAAMPDEPGADGAAPYNLTVVEPYVEPIEPFAAQFASLVIRVPPSVRIQLVERLGRKQYATDSTEPAVRAIIAKAVETYEKKKASGAVAAAARRARVRAAKGEDVAPARARAPKRAGVAPGTLDLVGGIGEDEADADEGDEVDEPED